MADSFTPNLGIRNIQTGAYNNTWGAVENSDVNNLFDKAIAGQTIVSIGSAVAYSMPAMAQGADSASRYFCLRFSGTPSAPCVVTMPSTVTSKFYLVDNFNTGQVLTFTYGVSSTNTVAVAAGEKRLIWCDGANCWDVNAAASSSLGGLGSANFARALRTAAEITAGTVVQNTYTGVTNIEPYYTNALPTGSTITLNAQNGNSQQVTLTANYTIGVPANPADGFAMDLLVLQDGTGGRLLTWNAIFLFQNGAAPTLSTVAGGADRFHMRYNASMGKWLVAVFGNITTSAGATFPLTITRNVANWRLLPLLGTLSGAITVTVTVNQGVIVDSLDPTDPAMDLSGLPSGSTVNLINLGYITGAGGDGADGAGCSDPGSGATILHAGLATAGGMAILGPGLSRSFNVTNTNGRIWGGGGGGGGGGAYDGGLSGLGCGNAGGGGGGAGGGRGGQGGRTVYISGASAPGGSGAQAKRAPTNVGGAAGSGTSYGTGQFGVAGAGGAYGAAGATGAAPSTVNTGHTGAFSAGGAAGKAIECQGAAPPTVAGSVLGLIS